MSQSIAPAKIHENYIDGLRGLAITFVVFHHATNYFEPNFYFSLSPKIFEGLYLGVHLFFIVSAFAIFKSSVWRFETDRYPKASFYLRRAFRILPWWWLNVAYAAIATKASWKVILMNATFLFGFSTDLSYRIVPGSWSLFVEEIFYIFFPLVFVSLNGVRNIHRLVLALVFALIVRVVWIQFMTLQGYASQEISWGSPLANLQWFFVGMLLYYLVDVVKKSEEMRLRIARSSLWIDIALALSLSLTMFTDVTFHIMTLLLIFTSGIIPGGLFHRIIHTKILREFGIRSYSLYFLHFYVLDGMSSLKERVFQVTGISSWPTELQIAFYGVLVLAIAFPISWFTFRFFERPCVLVGARVVSKLNRRPEMFRQRIFSR